jgi:hypothetical protein
MCRVVGLARAVRAEQAHDLPGFDRDVDARDGCDRPDPFREPSYLQDAHGLDHAETRAGRT